jgi:hypothetical protein
MSIALVGVVAIDPVVKAAVPPVIVTAFAFCIANVPKPKLVLAAAIDVAVPPYRSRTKHFDKKKANIITTRYGGYYT